jgi:hypothetical protein
VSNARGAARFVSWVLNQWPVPLVAAIALVAMLAAQRFGVIELSAGWPDTTAGKQSQVLQAESARLQYHQCQTGDWREQRDRTPRFPTQC